MPLLILTIFLPHVASAQTLVNLPGGGSDFDSYINSLYVMAISIAALLAVLKIVIAGVKWMTTDVVSTKGDAKNDIRGALLGLVIIIGAVVILEVINPNILEVDVTLRQLETPAPRVPTPEEMRDALCANDAVTGCISQTCGTDSTISCEQATTNCLASDGTPQQAGPNTFVCFTTDPGGFSDVETDINDALTAAETFVAANDDYSEIVEVYIVNNRDINQTETISIEALPTRIEQYAEECLAQSGTEFIDQEVPTPGSGITVRMCVR